MSKIDFMNLYFDVEDNTNISTDLEPAITRDHIDRLTDNIDTLRTILGINELIPMSAGSTIKRYKIKVTRGAKQAAEGDIIPLSKVTREEIDPIELELNPVRKLTTAQSIQRVGLELALNKTDDELIADVQKDIRNDFFDMITADTAQKASGGANLQAALAQAWGALSVYFEDKDIGNTIYFVNPLDAADYLGEHSITVENAFGIRYVEDFLGLGMTIITPRVTQGTVYATVSNNLNCAYVPQNGDVGNTFGLGADETGLVGMNHSLANDRASVQSLILSGVKFYVEDASGVISSAIGSSAEDAG